jgi:transcriptional regulator with XRE-family HTH domain
VREPTMADIAARLGVSRQLVSIALRGLPGASSETRERVQKVAEELSYRPHLAARSRRRRPGPGLADRIRRRVACPALLRGPDDRLIPPRALLLAYG